MTLNYRSLFDKAVENEESFVSPFDQPQQRQEPEQDASTTSQSNSDQPGTDSGGRNALLDIFAGVGNGIGNAVDSVVGITGIDIGIEDIFGETETFAGSAVEGITQFAVGFVPVFGALSKAGKLGTIGRGIAAGAAADFAVFDGQEERLSNLIQEVPGLANPVTEFLAADEDDSQVEGRIKNVLEGAAIGSLFDGLVFGLRQLKAGRKARAEGLSPEEAFERVREVEPPAAAETLPEDPYTRSIAESLNVPGREAEAVVALQDALGIERDSVKWERGGEAAEGALEQGAIRLPSGSPLLPDPRYPHVSTAGKTAVANERLTSNPDFGKWFSGSKVVDQEGRPLVFSLPRRTVRGQLAEEMGQLRLTEQISLSEEEIGKRLPKFVGGPLKPGETLRQRIEKEAEKFAVYPKEEALKYAEQNVLQAFHPSRVAKAREDLQRQLSKLDREGETLVGRELGSRSDLPSGVELTPFSPETGDWAVVLRAERPFDLSKASLEEQAEVFARIGESDAAIQDSLKGAREIAGGPSVHPDYWRAIEDLTSGGTQREKQALREVLEDLGYDAWVGSDGRAIAFSPSQVKATEARAFDPESLDILKQDARGSVEFEAETGQAIIRGFASSDFSTGVHELAHVARRRFINLDVDGKARLGIEDADIKAAEEWAGVTDGKWSVEAEEKFAQGFERYISEGRAPNSRLETLFRAMRDFMLDVYQRLSGGAPGVEISPKMREVFDKLVDREGATLQGRASADLGDAIPEEVLSSLTFDADQVRSFIQQGTDLQEGAFFQDIDLTVNPRRRPTENSRLQDETRKLLGLREDHYSIVEAAGDEGAAAIEFHRRKRLMPVVRQQVEAESRGARANADTSLERAEAAVEKYQRATGVSSKEEALGMLQKRLGSITDLRARQIEIEAEVEFQRMGLATAARDHAAETRAILEKMDRGTVTDAELATWSAMDRAMNELTAEIMGIKSSQGRALRNLKDIPNYIGGPGGAPVLQAYERIMADAGGRKGIERRIKALSEKAAADGDGIFVHEARKANRSNALNVTLEYWMNSILSGLKTLNINAIGGAAVTMYRPLEGMLGAAAKGQWKEMQVYAETYMDLLDSTSEAWRYTKQSFGSLLDEGENVLLPDSRSFQDGEARRAISAEAFGKADDSPMGKALNGTGAIVRLPSRSLQATDEFFKQLNARAIVKRGLRRQGLDNGLNGEELARFVEDGVDKIITDGELRTVQSLQRRAFETVKAANPQATEEHLRKLARKEFNDLWEKEGKHTEPLVQAAKEYAEDVTFTRALPEGSISKGLQDIVVGHPYLRFVLPFVRTPVNLLSAAYDRSPIAVARHAGEVIRKNVLGPNFPRITEAQGKLTRELSSPDPAVATEAYGRMYMATGTTFALMTAAANGNLTGRGPTDKELRRQLEATGWQPYSVKIGDTYVSYNRLDPFATVIGIVADFNDYGRWSDTSDQTQVENVLLGTVAAMTQNFTNKSYVTGIRSFVELLQNPEANVGTEAARLGASFIPSIIGQSAGVTDPYARELRSFGDSFANRIPYLSDNLDPVRNVLGEPVDRVRALGGENIPLFNAFLPIAARSTKDKKIHQELASLAWPFSPPPKAKQGQDLTQIQLASGHTAYDRWQELTGQVRIGRSTLKSDLRRLISSSRYQSLPPESEPGYPSPRVEEIRKVLRRYRSRAWAQLLREVPELRQATTTFERERSLRRRGSRQAIGL